MSVSMKSKACWMPLSSCAMSESTVDACPVCFLFSNLVKLVRAIVLIAGGASDEYVRDLMLCAGGVV